MSNGEIPTLMIGTIAIALIIGVVLLWRLLRKPENRHPMEGQRERNIEEIRDEAPIDRR